MREFTVKKPGARWSTLIQPRPLTLTVRTLSVDTLFGELKKTETKETRGSLKLLRDIALLPLGWPRSSKQFDVFNALRNVLVS